ncbi:Protein of unknown function DUF3127 [uncultured Caudovirales phage]|uniref:Uncharacterized protein n=1 Tax=uncultured Caudovirales phage TaxID=2100421 RepID=A0A6J5M8J6_9CAUD|nr:Protein of unknown function DUF3127 [uncultured Caudovirales phage]
MNYQYTGTIDKIFPSEQVKDTFRKRVIWLYNPPTSDKYDNSEYIQFEATQDNCGKLDMFKPGEKVVVTFAVRGRKYTRKTDGQDAVFSSLALTGIQSVHTQLQQPDVADKFEDVPF